MFSSLAGYTSSSSVFGQSFPLNNNVHISPTLYKSRNYRDGNGKLSKVKFNEHNHCT